MYVCFSRCFVLDRSLSRCTTPPWPDWEFLLLTEFERESVRVSQWFLLKLTDSHRHTRLFPPFCVPKFWRFPASFLTPTQPKITLTLHVLWRSLPYCQAVQPHVLDWQLLFAEVISGDYLESVTQDMKVFSFLFPLFFPLYETHSSQAHSLHPADSPQARAAVRRGKGKAWCSQAESTTLDNRGHLIFHPPPFPTYMHQKKKNAPQDITAA